jgi:hypothetical protein
MGYYHPTKVPTLRSNQIGAFTDGQGVDRTTTWESSRAEPPIRFLRTI